MDRLERFQTQRLQRPVIPPVELVVQNSNPGSASPSTIQRVSAQTQDLALVVTPSMTHHPRDIDTRLSIQKKRLQGRRSYNMVQVSEADRMFKLKLVETCAEQALKSELSSMTYNPNECREMSQLVAGQILERIKTFALTNYKLVCVVSIGSLKDKPAMQFGSRCLWNRDTDNFVSVKFTNNSIFAVAMIYGFYFD